jgi:hypothetical protein
MGGVAMSVEEKYFGPDGRLQVAVIDVTPKWAEVIEIYMTLLENGNADQQETARSEIRRMATIADAYDAEVARSRSGE